MVPEDRAAVRQACQLSVCCLFCEAEGAANVRSPCCLGLVLRLRGRRFQGRTKSNVAKACDACGAAGAFNAFGGGPARPRGQVPPKPSEQNARPAAQWRSDRRLRGALATPAPLPGPRSRPAASSQQGALPRPGALPGPGVRVRTAAPDLPAMVPGALVRVTTKFLPCFRSESTFVPNGSSTRASHQGSAREPPESAAVRASAGLSTPGAVPALQVVVAEPAAGA